MSAHASFWTRIGTFLRSAAQPRHANGNGHYSQHNTLTDSPPRSSGGFMRLMRSPGREAYERVDELMNSIERHFAAQDRRAEQLSSAIERIAGTLEKLGESQQAQESCIRSIAGQVETSSRFAATISDALTKMPASFQAQGDALRSIARQLEVLQESDGQLVISLQKFGTAADALHASGVAQVETLRKLHESDARRHGETTALIRDQGRRFAVLMALGMGAVILTVAAATITAVLLLR